jgi:hypothetical protein
VTERSRKITIELNIDTDLERGLEVLLRGVIELIKLTLVLAAPLPEHFAAVAEDGVEISEGRKAKLHFSKCSEG